jgi:tetratricopeptide (TPR) repeat protein
VIVARWALCTCIGTLLTAAGLNDLANARDRQDGGAINRIIDQFQQAVQQNPKSADAHYRLALAYSYGAEVAMELHDKKKSEALAEAGLQAARTAVTENEADAEYHRLLGALCGQVIPANPLLGTLNYGPCARDEINKAIQLNDKLALAYVTRGIGNYYLPAGLGGGLGLALKDFDKAISLDPKLADAYLWKGLTLRKSGQNAEARKALERALQLDPNRLWTKEQLSKTPAR